MIVLRLIHILSGTFWVGSAIFNSFFLMPAMVAAGPAAAPVMSGLRDRKLLVVIPASAALTMLSGFRMMWIVSGGAFGAYASTPVGRAFSLGALSAILGFIVGMAFARPAAMKGAAIGAAMAQAPDDATRKALALELAAVRKKGELGTTVSVVFIVLAAVAMAIARYLV